MNDYEKLLLTVIMNAGEKLIDSATLLNTEYSYRNSWYLAIIAQEELAKLIIIPFSNLAGTLDELDKRPSVAFSHPIKQKIFTTYGLQNRNHKKIEGLKQSYLYVSPSLDSFKMPAIAHNEVEAELLKAVLLFDRFAVINFQVSKLLSDEFKECVNKYSHEIFIPAIKSLNPGIAASMGKSYEDPPSDWVDIVQSYPLLFAEMITYTLPDSYKSYFREIEGKSFSVAIQILKKYMK